MGIQERLKKANAEFEHDDTPAELKHRQRVSFDAVVRAVDIEQDPREHDLFTAPQRQPVATVKEKPATPPPAPAAATSASASTTESGGHQYTVPLNDTQEREGPTLLQTIKAYQFHGIPPAGEHWTASRAQPVPARDAGKGIVLI